MVLLVVDGKKARKGLVRPFSCRSQCGMNDNGRN